MTTAAPPNASDSTSRRELPQRRRGGRALYVATAVAVVWAIAAVVTSVMSAVSIPTGAFSFGLVGGALFTAAMALPLVLTSVGIPAIVGVTVGGFVSRRVRALSARFAVIALAVMTAFVVPIALTWRGNEWDEGLVPTYVIMTLGVGLLLGLGAVLPWRGGFASRRYDAESATVPA